MTDDESEVRVGHFENMQVLDLDNWDWVYFLTE
jgi:hypothetical protein